VWQRLANGGEYDAALFELAQTGGFEQTIGHASAEQLMLLFDISRATAQHQRALAALRRIVAEYPSDPVAPLAAWSLANLLEKLGDAEGARQAFSTYRSLSPTGEFAEDALVRQLKNAISAGDRVAAKRLVTQYQADFPEGRRRAEVARWAAQTETAGAVTDSGVPETADLDEEPESAPAPSQVQATP
jgi:outer membrane protein assembly factor BamD (BamD/ComL family)